MGAGHEFHLLFGGPADAVPLELRCGRAVLRQLAPSARRLRAEWLLGRYSGWMQRRVERALGDLDLFHGTDGTAPILRRIPTVLTIHDLAFARFPETVKGMNRFYLSRMAEASARRAAAVIGVSEFTRRELLELFRLPADRVRVIPEGVETVFHPAPKGDQARASYVPTGAGQPYILAVGTLEPRKNLGALLEAFAHFRQHVPGHCLVIVGSQDFGHPALAERLSALGLEEEVRLGGSVSDEDLADIYRGAEFLVYPSKYEGFGLPPLEAMACGTPVLAARSSSIPEVVGEAAVLFDPDDVEEMAARMIEVAASPAVRDDLQAKGLARAAGFRWEKAAAATLEVYHGCRRSRPTAPT